MAEYNLGRVAFVDKGAYSPEETYSKWDFVTTVDSTYLFIGTTPQIGKPITDTSFWKCIADGKPATLAAAAANLAKEAANSSATLANDKAVLAQSAATLANTKAGLANDAAVLATDKASLADSKATLANNKAALAQSAADNANAKAAEVTAAVLSAGQLGSIKPTDPAPTPARNGNYTFSIGGNKPAWLTAEAGVTTVKAGDLVAVVYTAPSSYTYTHVDVKRISEVYNITNEIPLSGGSYYSLQTAVAAVPVISRQKGLLLKFEISSGVWQTYEFIGSSLSLFNVTIGGILQLKNWRKLQTTKDIPVTFTTGGYVGSAGGIVTDAGNSYADIDVIGGETYETCQLNLTGTYYALFDKNGILVSKIGGGASFSRLNYDLVIPANVVKARITVNNSEMAHFYFRIKNIESFQQKVVAKTTLNDNTKRITTLKKISITSDTELKIYEPATAETVKDATDTRYGVGYVLTDIDVAFNEIECRIVASNAGGNLLMKIYKLTSIPLIGGFSLTSPIYEQTVAPATSVDSPYFIKLSTDIYADGSYLLIAFCNENASYQISAPRLTGRALPESGDFTIPIQSVISNSFENVWIVPSNLNRYCCPILKFNKKIQFKNSNKIENDLTNQSTDKTVKLLVGEYGADNSVYSIFTPKVTNGKFYMGVDFRIDENVNIGNSVKELLRVDKQDGSYLRVFCECKAPTRFTTKQISYQNASDTTPEWNFLSEYPLPFYNSRVGIEYYPKGKSLRTTYFPVRNPRPFKPVVGKDAFSLQYKPQSIKNGGYVYENQAEYEDNKDWLLTISDTALTISSVSKSTTISFLFSTYATVDVLFAAIELATQVGGTLQDFEFEALNTGSFKLVYVDVDQYLRTDKPCTDLLKCTVKLVDKYPYTGTNAQPSKIIYDGWPAVIPYWKDESMHTLEFCPSNNTNVIATFDGLSLQADILYFAAETFSESNLTIGNNTANRLAATFKNFEFLANEIGDITESRYHMSNTFIASHRNPHIVSVMWHDVIPSSILNRNTGWCDVPKYMRDSFSVIKSSTAVGSELRFYRSYGDFAAEPVDIGGGKHSVLLRTGEVVSGVATVEESIITSILADTLVSGEWSTSTYTKFYEGRINRVGANVLHSTGFLQQVFDRALSLGYKFITFKEYVDYLEGKSKLPSTKCFMPQWDDFGLYLFTNKDIRRVFQRFGMKASIALEFGYIVNGSSVIDENALKITKKYIAAGNEAVIHNHWLASKASEFVTAVTSDVAKTSIDECIDMAGEFNMSNYIWDQSQGKSTPLSEKLMELRGIKACISTEWNGNVIGTSKMHISRMLLNPDTNNFFNPLV